MLRDFTKLNTFLTVIETKSFSKASKKLGISQPAVTQQIKLIESYLKHKIVVRKKSGIVLTPEGEELKKIALKLRKIIDNTEKDLFKIISDQLPFRVGACPIIGEYILPSLLTNTDEKFDTELNITIGDCEKMEQGLIDKKFDVALISTKGYLEGIDYKEWMQDEVVVFSNQKLPETILPKDLINYNWISREEDSKARKNFQEFLESKGMDPAEICNVQAVYNNITAIKNAILSAPEDEKP
ncbi:MAG: LysR family transcriptional regulator, partial [Campylobacterales bacterium]|nr:LysR family transcriptional regulator [Campylobacterales bacterium]